MDSGDKNWAKQYVLDPLTAPQPADETGPGTSFRPEPEQSRQNGLITPPQSATTARHGVAKDVSSTTTEVSNGLPSPRRSPQSSHRQEAFSETPGRRRGSSLGQRFPGDMSHRPLDQLKQEKAVADKSRQTTRKHHIQPDGIDMLDAAAAGGAYHHSGPYDATLFARNNSYTSSPVKAVSATNEETLKATPKDRIVDSVRGHRPLDGVAAYAPGEVDPEGHEYRYEQGENMMISANPAGGAYKRWPGVDYHPDDIKGKGEPSYTIEKALKKDEGIGEKGMEMSAHSRGSSLGQALRSEGYDDGEEGMKRSGSFSKRLSGGLKKRIGSLKRSSRHEE